MADKTIVFESHNMNITSDLSEGSTVKQWRVEYLANPVQVVKLYLEIIQ